MLKRYAPFLISLAVHIGLILYAHHVDTHAHKFGGLRYTDVDWRVVIDGAAYIFGRKPGSSAQGWLPRLLGWKVGDPYNRATFRYTPLLPLLLSPSLVHPLAGRMVLSLVSLLIPALLLSEPRPAGYWATHLLWTLNPFVLNITTRGSPEATIVFFVVLTLYCLRKADRNIGRNRATWESLAAVSWAGGISWKIYPIIYGITIWTHLSSKYGYFGWPVWRFGITALIAFVAINGALWSIWGQPFLDHTFLYHLTRQDHRHNFSAYFYPIYLSFFSSDPTITAASTSTGLWDVAQSVVRHPLASFVPQFGLVCFAGAVLTKRTGMEMAFFVQTAIFVIFNKVCTSQYFVWFIPLLAPLLPRLHLTRLRAFSLVSAWVLAQALWLLTAFRLEFLGEAVHMGLWTAGLGLLGVSTWIIGQLLDSYQTVVIPNEYVELDQSTVSPGKKRRRKKRHSGSAEGHTAGHVKTE